MIWRKVAKSNPIAVSLANRHYSRIAFGKQGRMMGPPGQLLCLLTEDQRAIWVSHWPYSIYALDRLDAYRCTMFRNEGRDLSSSLILEAMRITEEEWNSEGPPIDQWITWVAPDLISSSNPGYCFKRAGWVRDKEWKSSRKDVDLIRLRSNLITESGL